MAITQERPQTARLMRDVQALRDTLDNGGSSSQPAGAVRLLQRLEKLGERLGGAIARTEAELSELAQQRHGHRQLLADVNDRLLLLTGAVSAYAFVAAGRTLARMSRRRRRSPGTPA